MQHASTQRSAMNPPNAVPSLRIAIGVVASATAAQRMVAMLAAKGLAAGRIGASRPDAPETGVEAFRVSRLGSALEQAIPARLATELVAALRFGRDLVWVALATPEEERAACSALLRQGCSVQVHDLTLSPDGEQATAVRIVAERAWSAFC